MKILHLNTGQEGGAAWCARRINNALAQQGIESRMLFAEGSDMPDGIEGAVAEKDPYLWDRNWLFLKTRHLINRFPWICDADKFQHDLILGKEKAGRNLYLHHPCSHFTNISHHPLVEWADIIHLHWVPDFVDYASFFKAVKKPIIWTLHDKFPAVGLEHYCGRYSSLPESMRDLDERCIQIKRKGVMQATKLHIVAISEQMKEVCAESRVLNGIPCSLIHNGVDCGIFKPSNNEIPEYNIPSDSKVFMFSSYGIWDENKGLQRIIDALEQVECKNKFLIVVGNREDRYPKASFPIICTGLLQDQSKLAELYSKADFFIQASYEETFSQTPLESMACGTPVISTPCSGAEDIIRPFNGILCQGFDSEALANGINEAMLITYNRDSIRNHIVENFDYPNIARQYIDLYKSVL